MDGLFEAIGKLLGVFKDPVNVILLLVASVEGVAIWKLIALIVENWKIGIQNDGNNAKALEGVQRILEKRFGDGKS